MLTMPTELIILIAQHSGYCTRRQLLQCSSQFNVIQFIINNQAIELKLEYAHYPIQINKLNALSYEYHKDRLLIPRNYIVNNNDTLLIYGLFDHNEPYYDQIYNTCLCTNIFDAESEVSFYCQYQQIRAIIWMINSGFASKSLIIERAINEDWVEPLKYLYNQNIASLELIMAHSATMPYRCPRVREWILSENYITSTIK